MRAVFLITIFISSTLLFMVQPMLAKAFLPKVGGAPATWMVCMMFFQLLLLAGYAYAAVTSAKLTIAKQMMLHGVILLLAAGLSFPLTSPTADASAATQPMIYLLTGLFVTIALPYFVLSSHSSLLQRWYHARFQQSPYHLFAASNAGSLFGLLGYPLLFEWQFTLTEQYIVWMLGYGLLALCLVLVCTSTRRMNTTTIQSVGRNLPRKEALRVIGLAFIPSSLFLSTTLTITTDIASFPLLWVLPLALYLITMIIAYSSRGKWWTTSAQKLHMAAFFACGAGLVFTENTWSVLLYLAGYFVIAMHAHGKLAALKPEPENLTAYYFWLSVGGALGGVFNVLAPYIFNGVYEFWIVLLLSAALLPRVATNSTAKSLILFAVYLAAIFVVLYADADKIIKQPDTQTSDDASVSKNKDRKEVIYQTRNFYGVSRVMKEGDIMSYGHGTTIHGKQALTGDKRLQPTTYYVPINKFLASVEPSFFERPFGVLGLGVGTLACMGKAGQTVDMFEIDQAVIDIANNPEFFTYMRDCPSTKRTFLGDGRIELARMDAERYNLLIMDAFTSDAVPVHLLTREALQMYIQKLHPQDGVIAFNISNRHIDFVPILSALAAEQGMVALHMIYFPKEEDSLTTPSRWLIMAPKGSRHIATLTSLGYTEGKASTATRLWTDDYTNILPYIMW